MMRHASEELEDSSSHTVTNMKTDMNKKVEFPANVRVEIKLPLVTVKGPKGEVSRVMNDKRIAITTEGNMIVLSAQHASKKEKKVMHTYAAHLANMVNGVAHGFLYEMKICAAHFPMNVSISAGQLIIKNFIGEHVPRTLQLRKGVTVKVNGDIVQIESADKELAGLTASEIELLTRIRDHDRRIFQDGIFLIGQRLVA